LEISARAFRDCNDNQDGGNANDNANDREYGAHEVSA
jgi:hypothetical protein